MTNEEARECLSNIDILSFRDMKQKYFMGDVYEALDMGIKALEQTRWIPVSERLPEIAEWYLTSIKWADGTERVTISWFDGMSFKAEVKAWMPLPQPYKAEGSDSE